MSSIDLNGIKKRNNCTMNQSTKKWEIIKVDFCIFKNRTACPPVQFHSSVLSLTQFPSCFSSL